MLQNISTALTQNLPLPPSPSTLETIFYHTLFFALLFGVILLQQKLFWKLATFIAARPVWDVLDQRLKTKWLLKRVIICFTICCVVCGLACWVLWPYRILLGIRDFNIEQFLNLSPYCALWLALWLFLWYFASMVIQVGLRLPTRIVSETEIQPLNRIVSFFMFFHIFFLLFGERENFNKIPHIINYDTFIHFQHYLQYSICVILLVAICICAYKKDPLFKPLIMLFVAELITVKLLSVNFIAEFSSVSFILVGVIGVFYFCFHKYESEWAVKSASCMGVFFIFNVWSIVGIQITMFLIFNILKIFSLDNILNQYLSALQGLEDVSNIVTKIINFAINFVFPFMKSDMIWFAQILIPMFLVLFWIAAFFMSIKIARAVYKFNLLKNTLSSATFCIDN